jgi:oxygen-independent coproporphyrinogen-3 oxidase
MYLEGLARLERAAFRQYEISNVALPDRESRHNLKYWTGQSWRGLGCGAHTTIGAVRWHNVSATTDYIERISGGQSVASGLHTLSSAERVQEALFTGLRLTRGVDRAAFAARYGIEPWTEYESALADARLAGLVWVNSAAFGLTRNGMLMANEVLTAFV